MANQDSRDKKEQVKIRNGTVICRECGHNFGIVKGRDMATNGMILTTKTPFRCIGCQTRNVWLPLNITNRLD